MAPADPDLVAQDAPGAAVAADAHAAAADTAASATAPSEADADTDVAADADIDGDIDADADADADVDDHTAYTYAVDLQADEAVAAGAEHVELSAPASYFLENFIGAPVGSAVPAGTYDYEQGLWLADPDGRVVQLISITGGSPTSTSMATASRTRRLPSKRSGSRRTSGRGSRRAIRSVRSYGTPRSITSRWWTSTT
ncbi:MAG: hypothetical protein IPM79_35780 [Polyangiaceae bacterium]|nr:hypothetical protein [Polyangiaceae bacterium]